MCKRHKYLGNNTGRRTAKEEAARDVANDEIEEYR